MDSVLPANQITTTKQIQALVASKAGKLFLCLLPAAFLLRLFFVSYQYVINTDGVYYAILGRKLIAGDLAGGMSTYWSPLYPLLVGVSSLFFSDLEFAGRFVSVVAGTFLVIPTYFLIRNIYGHLPASVGAFLTAVYPPLIDCSTLLMTESLYVLIFTTALLTGWHALRARKTQMFFLAGLLYGAAYLTKPEAIGFVGLLFALTVAVKLWQKSVSFKKVFLNSTFLILGFLILSLPYVVYLHQKTGRWTISQKLANNISAVDNGRGLLNLTDDGQATRLDQLYGETYQLKNQEVLLPPVREISSLTPALERAPQTASSKLKVFVARNLGNLKTELKEMIPQIFPSLFAFFAILGLFRQSWTRTRAAAEIYLLLFLCATIIGYALTFVEERYLLPLLPILLCWAANGMIEFEKWALESAANLKADLRLKSVAIRTSVVVITVLSLVPSLVQPIKADQWANLPFEQKLAGLWVKSQADVSSPTIMSCGPWTAYYAEGRHLYLPNESVATTLRYATGQKVNYIVVSERCSAIMPSLENTPLGILLDERNAPPELKLVYKNDEIPAYKILVYELTESPTSAQP